MKDAVEAGLKRARMKMTTASASSAKSASTSSSSSASAVKKRKVIGLDGFVHSVDDKHDSAPANVRNW
jgi:hypothetical protein